MVTSLWWFCVPLSLISFSLKEFLKTFSLLSILPSLILRSSILIQIINLEYTKKRNLDGKLGILLNLEGKKRVFQNSKGEKIHGVNKIHDKTIED